MEIRGNLVDVINRAIYPAAIEVSDGKIASITPLSNAATPLNYILPGFIDAHVHIESSMLIPAQFARLAVVHGTVATVSDPHEIANVCGIPGVEYMIDNGNTVPFKFYFGAPSCVPATTFETAGARIGVDDIRALLEREEIKYLTEMMNFPGVLNDDQDCMQKIAAARAAAKPVDGHAPGLMGESAQKYIDAGISTDHECFTAEEAADKLAKGMKIIIREGSAAKNFEALIHLLNDHPGAMMFCSDDKHPDSLVAGHINLLCKRAIAKGIDLFHVLQAACINAVQHYRLDVGLLRAGDAADFIVVKDLKDFDVQQTYINGALVAEGGKTKINVPQSAQKNPINQFRCSLKTPADFAVEWSGDPSQFIQVIEALDGQLITNKLLLPPKIEDKNIVPDPQADVLKMVVVNRYQDAPIAKAFVKNFGLKRGAIASSVAHDSHNIVAVGVDEESICKAVNKIIETRGGVSLTGGGSEVEDLLLALPVGGLMSQEDGYVVAESYKAIDAAAKELGATLSAPFMTLSFMALLVIPHLKLSDKGLFNGATFSLTNLEANV